MNFYKHHIGDYAQATSHLSFIEDAAYSRLIRKYYAEESPLPADIKAVQRLVGARGKEEREAVEVVLNEFFELQDDGWHNKRCDEELTRANAQADTNRRIAEEREARKKAAKIAHAQSTIRSDEMHESLHGSSNDSLQSREPSQTPDTRHQTPDLVLDTSSQDIYPAAGEEKLPTLPGDWFSWFNRHHGTNYDPMGLTERKKLMPIFTNWHKAGVTPQQVNQAIKRAFAEATEPIVNLAAYVDRVLASQSPSGGKTNARIQQQRDDIAELTGSGKVAHSGNVIDEHGAVVS